MTLKLIPCNSTTSPELNIHNIPRETIINNFKEIADKYQEVFVHLLQGNIIPQNLINSDKNKVIRYLNDRTILGNPEKFCSINIEYVEKLRKLTTNAFAKLIGSPATAVFSPDNRDKRFKDSLWEC